MRIKYLPLLIRLYQIRVGIMVPVSCCGARCAPCRRRGCVAHRPLPLAPLPPPATGGGRLAPRTLTSGSSPTGKAKTGIPQWVSQFFGIYYTIGYNATLSAGALHSLNHRLYAFNQNIKVNEPYIHKSNVIMIPATIFFLYVYPLDFRTSPKTIEAIGIGVSK